MNISVFKRLIRMVIPIWPMMSLAALFGFLTIGSNIGLMATSAYLISAAALHPSIAELSVAIVGVRFFGIVRAVFRYAERYVSHDATFRLLSSVRVWFYQVIEPLAPAKLALWQSGDLFSAIMSDIESLRDFYLRVLAPPVVAIITLLTMIVWLAQFERAFSYVIVGAFVITGVFLPLIVRKINRDTGRHLVEARAELNAQLADAVAGIADLAACDQLDNQVRRISELSQRLSKYQVRFGVNSGIAEALGGFLMNLTVIIVLWLAIPLVSQGRLDGVWLAVLVLSVMSSFEAVLPLSQSIQYLSVSLAAAQRLFAIADTPPVEVKCGEGNPRLSDLSVENITFRYGAEGANILENISFDLPPGKRLAIVGPSGAGKSTLMHLILRFWEYQGGRIILGGEEICNYQVEEYRELFAVVSQQTHLFNTSIRDNILLARPQATSEQFDRAASAASLEEFIKILPQGYDTAVGQNGQVLSGGQRQRIAIARAMLKDTPFLILDEPTNGLDAITEKTIMASIERLMAGRTTVLITHRLMGLEAMDEVIVLDKGKIAERGSHAQLMEQKGLYYRLWHLQNNIFEA